MIYNIIHGIKARPYLCMLLGFGIAVAYGLVKLAAMLHTMQHA
jgi:hypothetical protein